MKKLGRNDPCKCGSGKKYKHCCLPREDSQALSKRADIASTAEAIRAAREHHQAGRLHHAEVLYQQVLQADPDHADALHMLGVIAHQAGKNDMAVELINKAIRNNQSDPSYYNNLGSAYKALKSLDKAIAGCRKALAIKPDFADAHNNLGIALDEKGERDEAIACFQKAIAIQPDLAEAHNNLGGALVNKGRLDEAVACFHKALAIKPDYGLAYNNLGNACMNQGKSDEAIVCYQKALEIHPDYAEAHYNLGCALTDWGKMDEAVASMRKALTLNPDFAQAHNNLGAALLEMGRLDEAVASVQTALKLNPEYAEAHFNLHCLLLERGDMEPSIRCLKRAIELRPDDTAFRFFLGMLLDYSGDAQAAADHFDRISTAASLDRARLDAWRYIKSASNKLPPIIGSPIQAFRLGIDAAVDNGLVLEFGVRFGSSIRQIAALAGQEVHGFDSFEGLPEAWHHEPRGSYSTKGAMPSIPENVILHAGWFEDTLPGFLETHSAPVRFMNIDCDLYSSTKTVFDLLAERIIAGTVMVFDEYISHEHWRDDEFRAFQEAVVKYGWNYEYLCFSFNTKQVVVRVI